eukprot:TRINITY_DN535_c0_g1_i1.p1 TRINITY_DN535_c0_g1~~TRINITY_DN535_c0_g1_i1.p1  ORF type:complete len:182 (-),score=52.35 TRINITY_DN535_c0_g1_i1:88-588(-)
MSTSTPLYFNGIVEKGFGRGGKQLNCPTANLSGDCSPQVPMESLTDGVYFGWAQIEKDVPFNSTFETPSDEVKKSFPVLPMVMSIGKNPHFNDVLKKVVEVHILAEFQTDFYGERVRAIATGYIRPQQAYSSLEALIEAIQNDISTSKTKLKEKDSVSARHLPFFI